MASALNEEPYPVITLENGLQVPWGAQYILEGNVLPRVREVDGPSGEFTGHLSGARNMCSLEITSQRLLEIVSVHNMLVRISIVRACKYDRPQALRPEVQVQT